MGLVPGELSSKLALKAGLTSPGSSVIKAIVAAAENSDPRADPVKAAFKSADPAGDLLFLSLVNP